MADGGALTFGGEQTIKYSHRPYGTDPYPSAFQALRARLPSLSPCGTNFVVKSCSIQQANRLWLTLVIKYNNTLQ